MYFTNALDKVNLGNAKSDGLEKDLHFKSDQYNILLSVFYIPYVLFAPPLGMLGKRFGPNRVLPIMMACFGAFTILGVAANNFGGLLALRWFLGIETFLIVELVRSYDARAKGDQSLLWYDFIVLVTKMAIWRIFEVFRTILRRRKLFLLAFPQYFY